MFAVAELFAHQKLTSKGLKFCVSRVLRLRKKSILYREDWPLFFWNKAKEVVMFRKIALLRRSWRLVRELEKAQFTIDVSGNSVSSQAVLGGLAKDLWKIGLALLKAWLLNRLIEPRG